MFQRIKHVHFVGIGGIGMSGIAEVLLTLGYNVSGSDLKASRVTESLVAGGAEVFPFHDAANVRGAHVVVGSSAVAGDNPEFVEARRLRIPVISRAEMLAELARLKYTTGVAGTHGKTTTTSMIATILDQAGMDPTFVIGGRVKTVGRHARLGKGEFIVLEADESDRSFLMLSPTVAVVTNLDADHLDNYRDLDDICDAFLAFVNKVPFYGVVVMPLGTGCSESIRGRIKRRVVTFGVEPDADVVVADCALEQLGSRFRLGFRDGQNQEVRLRVPGMHNVLNAAAAFAASLEMGLEPDEIAEGLARFEGVERRFEIKAREPFTVIDDYAHHPTEVRATLSAARTAGFSRIIAVFQPHRYTRTAHLFEEFARAFDDADEVVITDIYPAGESPIPGVTADALVRRVRELGQVPVRCEPDPERIQAYVRRTAQPGDAVLFMGAGSITHLADLVARTEVLRQPR
jgi:UDP-N-acetylmuramate--alanine ligase